MYFEGILRNRLSVFLLTLFSYFMIEIFSLIVWGDLLFSTLVSDLRNESRIYLYKTIIAVLMLFSVVCVYIIHYKYYLKSNINLNVSLFRKVDLSTDLERTKYKADINSDYVIKNLQDRVVRLRKLSTLLLNSIAVLIVSGVVLIIFSGNIVSSDAKSVSKISQVETLIAGYESRINDFSSRRRSLLERLETARYHKEIVEIFIEKPDVIKSKENFEKVVTEQLGPNGLSEPKIKVLEIQKNIRSIETEIDQISNEIIEDQAFIKSIEMALASEIDKFVVSNENTPSDTGLLVASAATRFGIVLIIVFLVQILVGVYRYSARITAFYESRIDILLLSGKTRVATELSDLMMPSMIDFGRNPAPPQKYISDIIRSFGKGSDRTDDSKY